MRILKKHNVCGVNNGLIGMVLGDYLHDAEGAEKYLGKAFVSFADTVNEIMVGYANVFFQRKNYNAAIDCFAWLRVVLRGIQPQENLTWFDKYECVLLETIAECYYTAFEYEGDKVKALIYTFVIVLTIWLAAMLLYRASLLVASRVQQKLKNELRHMVGTKLGTLSYADFTSKDSGHYVSWLTNDVDEIYSQSFAALFSGIENLAMAIWQAAFSTVRGALCNAL